jgi:cell division protein FtsQ
VAFRRFLAVTVVLTLLYVGLLALSRLSYFRVQTVDVVGNTHETAGQVIAMSGLDDHPPMLTLNGGKISDAISELRWVSSVTVTRHWPHRVTLTVHERTPVAVAPDGVGVLHLVDGSGHQLDPATVGVDLPHLAAVGGEAEWPFDRWARPAATVARRLPTAFAGHVRTVSVDVKGRVTLHFTTPVTFYIGPIDRLHAKFVAIASVLAERTLGPHSYVDVSVPSAVTVEIR